MKTMIKIIAVALAIIFIGGSASSGETNCFGFYWHIPEENNNINGVKVGVISIPRVTNAVVNGVRLELVGPGFLAPLAPDTAAPCWETENKHRAELVSPGENVYGLELSGSGTCMLHGEIVGMSLGLIGGIKKKVTGIVGTLGHNTARDLVGIQFAGFNTTYRTVGIQAGFNNRAAQLQGLQLGVFNGCRSGHGIQIGIWNSSERRSFPLINWI